MINLLNAELASLRYRSRTMAALVALIVLGMLMPIMWMGNARPTTQADLDFAAEQLAAVGADCPDCTIESFLSVPWDFPMVVESGIAPMTSLVAFIVMLIVLFYVGSDFTTGTLWTRLTFTPKRTQMLLARTLMSGVLGAAMMALTVVTSTVVSAVWFVAMRGFGELLATEKLLGLLGGSVMYGFFIGLIGSLAVFLTNGTIGAGMLLISVLVASVMAEILGFSSFDTWIWHLSPLRQHDAILQGQSNFWSGVDGRLLYTIERTESIIYHLVVVVLLAAVTIPLFERRDLKF